MKIIQAEFKREINFCEETRYKNRGRQIVRSSLSSKINKQDACRAECDLQGSRVQGCFSDVFVFFVFFFPIFSSSSFFCWFFDFWDFCISKKKKTEKYNEKKRKQAWRASRSVATRTNHEDYGERHPRASTTETFDFAEGAAMCFLKRAEDKSKYCHSWKSKGSCSKRRKMFCRTWPGKEREGQRTLKKREIVVTIESVTSCILRTADTSRKILCSPKPFLN